MKHLFLLTSILLFTLSSLKAQNGSLSLKELIQMAQKNSLAAGQVATEFERSQWAYKSFQAGYLPQVALEADLPAFSRYYAGVTQDDGSVEFQPIAQQTAQGRLTLNQAVPFTGGQLYVSSALTRFDNFQNDKLIYNSRPVVMGLQQPIMNFNAMKWERKIEPLKVSEARKVYTEQMEAIGSRMCQLFFAALLAQSRQEVAQTNVKNQQKLLKIAQSRYEMGKISRSDLLQLKLALVNAQKRSYSSRLVLSENMRQLKAYLGYRGEGFSLRLPEEIPAASIDQQVALQKALQNRKEETAFERRLLEAEREVARAKGENGFTASLEASFGYNNQGDKFKEVYTAPIDQQTVKFSFRLPIADWGKAKAQRKTAQANKQLSQQSIAQERLEFQQQVLQQAEQFEALAQQVRFAGQADQLAAERYQIALERFALSDMSITEMMFAQNEKEQARLDYLGALQDFWQAWYRLRALTLYDFQKQKDITYQAENPLN